MKKIFLYILSCLTIVLFLVNNSRGQEKLAQAGMEFLGVVSDSRVAALGSAVTSRELGSAALFFNPGTMGFDTSMADITFSLNKWIFDIRNNNLSVALRPFDGDYGTFGLSLQLVDYGEILGTRVANNDKGYVDLGNLSASGFAAGIGYAKALSEQFSVGGQVKWVRQSLGNSVIPDLIVKSSTGQDSIASTKEVDNKLSVVAFDFGTLFKTGYKSLQFGMSVRNFSQEIKYVAEGFQLPLTFSLGISMNLMDYTNYANEQSLMFSVDAINVRSHIGQVGFGLEYGFMNYIFLRGGYTTNNGENNYSLGVGVSYLGLKFDYAYSPYGILGDIQRMTVRFSY